MLLSQVMRSQADEDEDVADQRTVGEGLDMEVANMQVQDKRWVV